MQVSEQKQSTAPLRRANLLHVGCGEARPERLPALFKTPYWREIRFDIDPSVRPDVIGSITDMSMIQARSIDAIWSSHNLEHLHSFDIPSALAEFRRVLRPDGFALICVPDLKSICMHVVNGGLEKTLYVAAAGPIAPMDMIFGHQASIERGNQFMAHKTGFTSASLGAALIKAGFAEARVREGTNWDLWAVATMPETTSKVFDALANVQQ